MICLQSIIRGMLGLFFGVCCSSVVWGAALIDEDFKSLSDWDNICTEQTVMMLGDSELILGGPGSKGEKAGCRISIPGSPSAFELILKNLHWSHNAVKGGHPTEIQLLNTLQQGYVVVMKAGTISFFRQDSPEQRMLLIAAETLWNPEDGFTVSRTLTISRDSAGQWTIGFSDQEKRLTATDGKYLDLSYIAITYGVFMHGYSLNLDAMQLNDLKPENSERIIAVLNPWGDEQVAGVSTMIAATLNQNGTYAKLLDGKTLHVLRKQVETLLIPGTALSASDMEYVLEFLRAGGNLMILGPVEWDLTTSAGHRFCERILGMPEASRLRSCSDLTLTAAGRAFPGLEALISASESSVALLPQTNSVEKQVLLSGVEKIDLAAAYYSGSNWVQLPDHFRGTPLQLTVHRTGEFAGSRVIYAGFPLTGESALNPKSEKFSVVVRALLAALKVPAAPSNNDSRSGGLSRKNFFRYPGAVFGALCFANYRYLEDPIFDEDLDLTGMQVVCYCIPWLLKEKDGEIVDWERLDQIFAAVNAKGKKLMLDPYPYNFNLKSFNWIPDDASYQTEFRRRYLDAIEKIVTRYRDNQTLVAMWCTPHTHSADFAVYRTETNRQLWAAYLQTVKKFSIAEINHRYGIQIKDMKELPFPEEDPNLPFNIGPIWSDYVDYHVDSYQNYLREVIQRIRRIAPDLPLTIRSAFMDPALSMAVAAEFENVATHIECLETSINTEGFYRSYALGFGIPITGENGWPKASPAATRMALADYLMGGYSALTYSFDGIRWARESYPEFRRTALIKQELNHAVYPKAQVGLLLPDATLYSSRPANFFSIEKFPSLELTMERMTIPFVGVSSELPRWNGLNVVVDTGSNRVFPVALKTQLAEFIRKGGTFIGFPESGKFSRDGSDGFWASLGIAGKPGTYTEGNGKVIILESVTQVTPENLQKLLIQQGVTSPITLSEPVCNVLFEQGTRRYLLLFDKRRELVGSFFKESTHEQIVAGLPTQKLTIVPSFSYRQVTELMTENPIQIESGKVTVELPPATLRVLRFE